ncbi:MAG: L-serine ammonia-lyase [Planctomycetota bacterium]|nr:L-serine ammonia-lyase [Planctomycetota bacterium]
MTTRLLDLYRIGPGPSSSHTVGPMRAARAFREAALAQGIVPARLRVDLMGSLSATGRGHGTDRAVLAGLLGWRPDTCDVDALLALPDTLREQPSIEWGAQSATLHPDDVRFLPYSAYRHEDLEHPNTLRCTAFDTDGGVLLEQTWCSTGGGFVEEAGASDGASLADPLGAIDASGVHFHDCESLVAAADQANTSIGALVLAHERAVDKRDVRDGLDRIWDAMQACIRRGLEQHGTLPGGLGLRRRAGELNARIEAGDVEAGYAHIARAQAYAFAVNEENAAGGRVVTAPTNGAAGIVPAVLTEVAERLALDRDQVHRALATAGVIGALIKTHASLSGAEVGCQGEVGSATAMAAAALCEILGGTPAKVEYAAEIAMEHNLGLTCDPLKGLVQAPCIERNAMGVAKAWSAAQLALHSDGMHLVSFDRVIQVMKRTGNDMRREYKETGEGGLAVAVNLPEC